MKHTSSSTAVELFEHAAPSAHALDAAGSTAANSTAYRTPRSAGVSRDEMNLAEFPLAVLSTRVNPDIKTLEFTDSHRQANGEVVQRKWIITGADKFGLPTSTDDDVVLGLMRMTMDQGFRDRKVYFTRYELLKTLRWSTEGRSYSRLIKSLDRLSGVRIRSSNAFYDNTTKTYQTRNFGIIDAYEIQDERSKRQDLGGEAKSFFIWSEVLFHSFKAGFVKKLDLDFYFTLRSAVSRRLYRYLDKHFYYRSSVEVPLKILAFEKLGLSRTYQYVSSIKQQLEPAAQELVKNGFLSSYEFEGRGNAAVVRFFAQRATEAGIPERAIAARNNTQGGAAGNENFRAAARSIHGQRSKLIAALISRGMAEAQAKKLLRGRKEDECSKIAQIISYYDHLIAANDPKISRSPVGFLYRAVELPHKFSIPTSFTDTATEEGTQRSAMSRTRPELKIFSSRRNQAAPGKSRAAQNPEAAGDYPVNAAEVAELRNEVEKRMAFLKTVLSPENYRQAVEGCILQELAKRER